ncbi:hypothetical protein [Natronomonas sp. EA1]|uniref:hypothetical protein n=1 Tax=Natronomonas sp. EA1 TaxID=3421655 RepID=UPI003EB9DAFC
MQCSRRRFIGSTLGLAGVGATGGCLTPLTPGEPAFLSYKAVEVEWETDRGERYVADLCWLWSDGRSRVFGWAPEEYPAIVRTATDVTVSAETARALDERFAGVRFRVGLSRVGTTGLSMRESDLGTRDVSRARFNRVQFGDRLRAVRTDSGVRIRSVRTGGHGDPADWSVTVGTKALTEQFPDRQVPDPR